MNSFSDGLLLFYTYCILGWVWESVYVSVRKHHWVNRGFLYGPWLPIYGFGAMIILIATKWCSNQPILVFLFGMLSATILEYFTAAAMERIFQVRYWDYSHLPLNLNGYICLRVSLGWGLFSLVLIFGINPLVSSLITPISDNLGDILSVLLSILFAVDFTKSMQDALDMKAFLKKLYESNETIARVLERLAESSEKWNDSAEHCKKQLHKTRSILRRNPTTTSHRHAAAIAELLNERITERIAEFKQKKHDSQKSDQPNKA